MTELKGRVEGASTDYTDFRIPGLVATDCGTLLYCCECRRSSDDYADIDIKVARSDDGGASFEGVLLLKSEGNTLNNPVLIVDGERILLLYCINYRELWQCVSLDDGRSFGRAQRVYFEDGIDFFYNAVAVGPGHGIVFRGRLIVPLWFAYNQSNPKGHRPSHIATLYSDDRGESWRLGELIFPDELKNPSECALAVTAEDELLISIRHEGEQRRRGLAKSCDGISAWRELRFEECLPDPICMGSMTCRDGRIYYSGCASESERTDLTVKISDDCFKTCRSIYISEYGGYSDIALLGDRLYILYEKSLPSENEDSRYKPFELFFESIELGEYEGDKLTERESERDDAVH